MTIRNEQLKFCGIIWCTIKKKYHLRKLGEHKAICGSYGLKDGLYIAEMPPKDPPEDADFCKTCLAHYKKQFGDN